MAKELDPKETDSLEEVFMSEIIQSEALVNLLEKKGIITREELREETKKVHAQMAELKG
jgi:hypothetical protein